MTSGEFIILKAISHIIELISNTMISMIRRTTHPILLFHPV